MGKVELYYFSGTGNSLYAARELHKRIPGASLIPIVGLLDKEVIEARGDCVGFVFPVYFTAIPSVVKDFIKKLNLGSSKYIFAVATRVGTTHSAFESIEKHLQAKGKSLDAGFSLNMANNNPRFKYRAPTQKELKRIEAGVQDRLNGIHEIIKNNEVSREKDTGYITRVPFVNVISLFLDLVRPNARFFCDSKCSGCGTCERVCLSQKIKMMGDKPVWQKDVRCYHCWACINYCPMQSVQANSKTKDYDRYPHPYADADDIAAQKAIEE